MKKLFAAQGFPVRIDIALLLVRLICGCAFTIYGSGKIKNPMGWMGPDAAVPGIFQALAALSEFGGGIAWILGLLTPLASLGIACTMVVAVHMHMIILGDPFVNLTGGGSYDTAAVYLVIALLLLAAGPGRFSLDRKIFGVKS